MTEQKFDEVVRFMTAADDIERPQGLRGVAWTNARMSARIKCFNAKPVEVRRFRTTVEASPGGDRTRAEYVAARKSAFDRHVAAIMEWCGDAELFHDSKHGLLLRLDATPDRDEFHSLLAKSVEI